MKKETTKKEKEVKKEKSAEYLAYEEYLKGYAERHPVKYEATKDQLLAKLAKL
jgi:hypothetical protein